MTSDDLVLLALALLYRLVDSLLTAAVWVLAVLAIVVAAGALVWAGRALPTGRPPPRSPTDPTDT